MISIEIPRSDPLHIQHICLDVNGTLAADGKLIPGFQQRLNRLQNQAKLHLLSADSPGMQSDPDRVLGMQANRITPGQKVEQKMSSVQRLGGSKTAAIGQGANDRLMLMEAELGICLIAPEGTALEILQAADLMVNDICSALDLFLPPRRLTASLRT